jgi:glycerol-3-phosphate dehydrogenase
MREAAMVAHRRLRERGEPARLAIESTEKPVDRLRMRTPDSQYDLLVVGAGINGAGIARDAAGRGLSVLIIEKGDLASATSQWSTKLIHGGLRYLEQFEFRLVRERRAEVVIRRRTSSSRSRSCCRTSRTCGRRG